ncbi:MAG: ribose-5-phosphate isomerase [Actinomycetales bacterium]|nr:ribose-5-phosphate isomerase [Actinomycetales bacterium]
MHENEKINPPTRKYRVVIGSDDAAYEYKERLKADLLKDPRVSEVIDVGMHVGAGALYPHVARDGAAKIVSGEADRGILLCGTGLGMAISANKVHGIRAVTAHDSYSVERSVKSNNAQVLCMGQRVIGIELARKLMDEWLDCSWDESSPSSLKVAEINAIEDSNTSPSAKD